LNHLSQEAPAKQKVICGEFLSTVEATRRKLAEAHSTGARAFAFFVALTEILAATAWAAGVLADGARGNTKSKHKYKTAKSSVHVMVRFGL
jgi:hypothetical protein